MRKLQHRARKNSPNGDYRCYDANGWTYCGGGGIGIMWRAGPRGRESAELLTFTATQLPMGHENPRQVNEGRAEAYRKLQVDLDEARRRKVGAHEGVLP